MVIIFWQFLTSCQHPTNKNQLLIINMVYSSCLISLGISQKCMELQHSSQTFSQNNFCQKQYKITKIQILNLFHMTLLYMNSRVCHTFCPGLQIIQSWTDLISHRVMGTCRYYVMTLSLVKLMMTFINLRHFNIVILSSNYCRTNLVYFLFDID